MRFVAPVAFAMLVCQSARAEAPLTISVYAPTLYFAGSAENAAFLSALEKSLGEALGKPVLASISADFKAMGRDGLWLVESSEVATRDNLVPAVRAKRKGGAEQSIALYSRKKWPDAFTLLSTGTVAIPGGAGQERLALRHWLLLDEPGAGDIASRMKAMRDARAALQAVAAGESDAALVAKTDYSVLDARLANLEEVTILGELPTPILAVNTSVIKSDVQGVVAKLRKAELPTLGAQITGWESANSDDLSRLSKTLRKKVAPISRDYILADLPPFTIDLTPYLPPVPQAKPLDATLVMPKGEFQPLPDIPEPPAETTAPPTM